MRVLLAELFVRQRPAKLDRRASVLAQRFPLLPFANDVQTPPQTIAGLNGQVEALVVHKLPRDHVVVLNSIGEITGVHLHGRMNNG